jgi:hypothetical protein
MKKLITLLLPLLSICAFFLVGEIVVRSYHFLSFDISMLDGKPRHPFRVSGNSRSLITLDEKLGWRATENYRFEGVKHTPDGKEYPVKMTQDGRGFRMFGDLSSVRPKVFVLGDSFTQAADASDDSTYFAFLKKDLNYEVFAYGASGFGSLQEYMILDEYFDLIKPDLIIWQYSANDIVNNSPELETASTSNNNGMLRPYWIDNHVQYILPTKDSAVVRQFALRYCRICYLIVSRMDRLRATTQESVESQTAVGKPAHPLFLDAVRITDQVMAKVRQRAGNVPIFAFIVGDSAKDEYFKGLEDVSLRHDIRILPDVNAAVENAEKEGTVVRGADNSHWNPTGHRIASQAIVSGLEKALPQLVLNPQS